jgi:hypothetical protein
MVITLPAMTVRPRTGRGFGSRSATAWLLTAAVASGLAYGQDDARPEQLRKRYGDALAELKQAQDRKTQLAAENEKLTARVAELQKQLDAANGRIGELTRTAEGFDDRTFFLRSHYAAWKAFVSTDPELKRRWDAYLRGDGSDETSDRTWPFPSAN